jgi:hypothetical protein
MAASNPGAAFEVTGCLRGLLTELHVWERHLDGYERAVAYTGWNGQSAPSTLAAYYPMEEGAGGSTRDATGVYDPIVMYNGPSWLVSVPGNGCVAPLYCHRSLSNSEYTDRMECALDHDRS